MPEPKNAMEIFRLLDKSNCRECGKKTCLAFAGAVFQGQISLEACPKLDANIISQFSADSGTHAAAQQYGDEYLHQLKNRIRKIDLAAAAKRLGAQYANGLLTLKVLGKDFSIDADANLYADIHINPWVAAPFMNHVLDGKGIAISGEWVSFRELDGGPPQYALFHKRCETNLKRIADTYTDLFNDMIHLLGGRDVGIQYDASGTQFDADISVVLKPLPKIPLMVCYLAPEDGIDSSLHVYFDKSADQNLDIDSIFTLGVGITQMLERLSQRHG